jgi:centromere/kinetochore protein ZW10
MLQDDIIRSKTMANDIARQSEAPDVSGETIHDAEDKAEFLNREVQYSQQLYGVLKDIQRVNNQLGEAEEALSKHRILDALRLLESEFCRLHFIRFVLTLIASWKAMGEVGASKSCRVMRILDVRAFELKSAVYELFNQTWKSMIQVDVESGKITIRTAAEGM